MGAALLGMISWPHVGCDFTLNLVRHTVSHRLGIERLVVGNLVIVLIKQIWFIDYHRLNFHQLV